MLAIAGVLFFPQPGSWSAPAVAGAVMYVFGTSKVRKSMHLFACLTVFMGIARPGVRPPSVDLTRPFDPDRTGPFILLSEELWPVAIASPKTSPFRGLFGHGGLSTEAMDLSDRFDTAGARIKPDSAVGTTLRRATW